jgi:cell wall-associated NlpC family hydrolase
LVLDTARAYRQATPTTSDTPKSSEAPKPPDAPKPSKTSKPAETPRTSQQPKPSQQSAEPRVADRPKSAALTAVAFARAQLGKPYEWGGNGSPGYDCSGLTTAAYAAAKIKLPRTAQTQYNYLPRLAAGAELKPGDLLFFGTPRRIHHVGISLGGTRMIHAPTFGKTVGIIEDYRVLGDYAGASRPAAATSD